jgi:hypothetical protein
VQGRRLCVSCRVRQGELGTGARLEALGGKLVSFRKLSGGGAPLAQSDPASQRREQSGKEGGKSHWLSCNPTSAALRITLWRKYRVPAFNLHILRGSKTMGPRGRETPPSEDVWLSGNEWISHLTQPPHRRAATGAYPSLHLLLPVRVASSGVQNLSSPW